MIFKKIDINSYTAKLCNPLKNSKHIYKQREGFIIKLYLDHFCGNGEAAPLPYFSNESQREIIWKFEELKAALSPGRNYEKTDFLDLFELFTQETPSLNFALDIALYDILSQIKQTSLSKYLNKNAKTNIQFSDIYHNDISQKNTSVKIKLVYNSVLDSIKYFKKIVQNSNQLTQYRIDANRAYNLKDAIILCNTLEGYNIEYIEEPLIEPNVKLLKQLKQKTNIPIAIDETIIESNYKELILKNLIDYAILKAPLYGSIKKIFSFKKFLDKNNVKLVLSSSLQTEIGNMSSIHIASALEVEESSGLNNYQFFNYVANKLPYKKGDIAVNLEGIIGLGIVL